MDQTLAYPAFVTDFDQQGSAFDDFDIPTIPTHQGQPVSALGVNSFRSSYTTGLSQPGSALHTPSSSQSYQGHNRGFSTPVVFTNAQYGATSTSDANGFTSMNGAGPSNYAQPGSYTAQNGQLNGSYEPSFVNDEQDEEQHEQDNEELYKQEIEDVYEEGEGAAAEGQGEDDEEPLYVNAKQYHRILKRRIARQRLEELNRLSRSRKVRLSQRGSPASADHD